MKTVSELENYLQRIENLRRQIYDLVTGLPAEALNWRPLESDEDHAMNSIAVMATHVAGSEQFWITEAIGGQPPRRDREAEFVVQVDDFTKLHQLLNDAGEKTRKLLSTLPETELDSTREVRDQTLPVRWILVHVIDHTALHLGHMQITYQLWQGGRGVQAPRWFERLPK